MYIKNNEILNKLTDTYYSRDSNKRVTRINMQGIKQQGHPTCFSMYCYVVTNKRESMEKNVKNLSVYTCLLET